MNADPSSVIGIRLGSFVQRQSSVPLHHQIKVAVMRGIEEGWLKNGDRLPRESELASAIGVSIAPLRQALADLDSSGLVERQRGRGTFIRSGKFDNKIAVLGSFHDSLQRQGITPTIRVLVNDLVSPTTTVRRRLPTVESTVWFLRRLADIDGEPVALLNAWLPSEYLNETMRAADFSTASLYDMLDAIHAIRMSYAKNEIDVANVTTEDASLMGLSVGAPVLRVQGVTSEGGGRPIEYSEVLYHAQRFQFSIESTDAGAAESGVNQ
ncbi:MAG TPA: GntR family transcriptional regulator [Acidimicrobiales bacterium]